MYSIAFPNIFSHAKTMLVEDHEATFQNLRLVLLSTINNLFGDPGFGNTLKNTIFSQNDSFLDDIVIDKIYTCIKTFMPQVIVNRNDIQISKDQEKLYATISATNLIDYQTNLYEVALMSNNTF